MSNPKIDFIQQKTRELKNPVLLKLIREMKNCEAPTQQQQEEYAEALTSAVLIVPVSITSDENAPDDQIKLQFAPIKNKEGQGFLATFTDMETLLLNVKDDEKLQVIGFNYNDITKVLSAPENRMAGFVINPFTENVIVGAKQGRAINAIMTQKKVKSGELAMITEAKDIPDEIMLPIEKYFDKTGKVKKAYFMSMQSGETTSRLIIVDLLPGFDFAEFSKEFGQEVLKPIEDPEQPFFIMPITEKAAMAAAKENVPFYVKV